MRKAKWFMLTLQEARSIHDSINISKKMNLLLIFTFYYKYIEFIYNLGNHSYVFHKVINGCRGLKIH